MSEEQEKLKPLQEVFVPYSEMYGVLIKGYKLTAEKVLRDHPRFCNTTHIDVGLASNTRTPSSREKKLEEALESIAANTCCDKCQEAALVARAALKDSEAQKETP